MLTGTGTSRIEAIGPEAARRLNVDRVVVACIEPNNGSRYVIVLTKLSDDQARALGGSVLVALPDWRTCYPFTFPGYFTADYVAEKLTAGNLVDAEVVARFLNEVKRDG